VCSGGCSLCDILSDLFDEFAVWLIPCLRDEPEPAEKEIEEINVYFWMTFMSRSLQEMFDKQYYVSIIDVN